MKYTIRKRENVTLYLASEPATLDDKAFRNLEENPYTGNSEEEFLKYIANLDLYEGAPPDLSEKWASELEKLSFDVEMKEFGSSAEKYGDIWFESGKIDKEYTRYGGFNAILSTKE